jgi:hypothetical protein
MSLAGPACCWKKTRLVRHGEWWRSPHSATRVIATGSGLSLTPMSAVPPMRQVRDVLLSFALDRPAGTERLADG